MTTWALLAPGPSASKEIAERIRQLGLPTGAIGCAYQLAPWADFIAATDCTWWRQYEDAKELPGKKFTMHAVSRVEAVKVPCVGICNSGVLGLECAVKLGATTIVLLGMDMHGTHFFGPYTNGLSNTDESKRKMHLRQFDTWRRSHPRISVYNCTEGSSLKCFPMARLEDVVSSNVQMEHPRISGEVHIDAREHVEENGSKALLQAA